MIKDFDAEDITGLPKFLCEIAVFGAGLGVAAGVIVDQDSSDSPHSDQTLEGDALVDACVVEPSQAHHVRGIHEEQAAVPEFIQKVFRIHVLEERIFLARCRGIALLNINPCGGSVKSIVRAAGREAVAESEVVAALDRSPATA